MATVYHDKQAKDLITPTADASSSERDVPNPEDPAAPSREVSSKKQSLSDIFTILCAGFALISDGYQNSLMLVLPSSPKTGGNSVVPDELTRRLAGP